MKINSKFAKIISFSLLMENVQEEPTINFVVDTGKMKVAFPCVILEDDKDNTIQVEIPKLYDYKNVFTEDEYPAYIEAIVGESYKRPWKCKFQIETPQSIDIEPQEIQEEEKPEEISMTIDIKDIKETSIEPEKTSIDPDELVELSQSPQIKKLTEEPGDEEPEQKKPEEKPKKSGAFFDFINRGKQA